MEIDVLCFGDPNQRWCHEVAAWVDETFDGDAHVTHIDVWEEQSVALVHGVMVVPTVIVRRGDDEVARFIGAPRRRALQRFQAQADLATAA